MIDVETIFDSDKEEYEFMQENKEQPMKDQIEKQAIEEMAKFIKESCAKTPCFQDEKPYTDCDVCTAIYLYSAGYRRQSEGEWIDTFGGDDIQRCSVCNHMFYYPKLYKYHFCPNCGARMSGGKNE